MKQKKHCNYLIFIFALPILMLFACPVGTNVVITPVISAPSEVSEGLIATITAKDSRVSSGTIEGYHWEQVDPPSGYSNAQIAEPNSVEPRITVYNTNYSDSPPQRLRFRLTIRSAGKAESTVVDILVKRGNIDLDGDGLIEIRGKSMLNNMRYNLAGTSYKASPSDAGTSTGCPGSPAICTGYELISDLDFDSDGDGTWTWDQSQDIFTLDSDDNHDTYFPIASSSGEFPTSGAWMPIGSESEPFTATFDGNGHAINGIAMQRDAESLGFISAIDGEAIIRNIGLTGVLIQYTNSSTSIIRIGGLVGHLKAGRIINSYVAGQVRGGRGENDHVGGLVGGLSAGYISDSNANVNVSGRDGSNDNVGGLLGYLSGRGNINASFALGQVNGGPGADSVGGLLGFLESGQIYASFARSEVDGGAGIDFVGGLVGHMPGVTSGSEIVNSYATGNVFGNAGDTDKVGGLVGRHGGGRIVAVYATGTASGGQGASDKSGKLYGETGETVREQLRANFGFGMVDVGSDSGDGETVAGTDHLDLTKYPRTTVSTLTLAIANDPNDNTGNPDDNMWSERIWDFDTRTSNGGPSLKYGDYDRPGETQFHCADRANPPTGAILIPRCGHPLPNQ